MSAFWDWCKTVTQQVRFWPDHAEIIKELEAHYEDHVLDLERLGYPAQLAQQRALEAMGDPEEVGRGMDAVHQPLLGWLWMVSRWGVWLLLFIAFLMIGSDDMRWFSQFTDPAPRNGQYEADGFFRFEVGGWENEHAVLAFTGTGDTAVERGRDIWSIPYAAVWKRDYPDVNGGPSETLYWTTVVLARDDKNPFDAADSAFKDDLVLTASDGTYYDDRYARIGTDENGRGIWGPANGRLHVAKMVSDPFRTLYYISFTGPTQDDPPGEWCEVAYPYGEPWSIRVDWEEAAP